MFAKLLDGQFNWGVFMERLPSDSDVENPPLTAVPLRCPAPMRSQPIHSWTLSRAIIAFGEWLMAKTPIIPGPKQDVKNEL